MKPTTPGGLALRKLMREALDHCFRRWVELQESGGETPLQLPNDNRTVAYHQLLVRCTNPACLAEHELLYVLIVSPQAFPALILGLHDAGIQAHKAGR